MKLSVFTALLTIVAATFSVRAMDQAAECNATTSCTVEGTLRIFQGVPYAAAHIEGRGRCYIVALPDYVLKQWRNWNDVQVKVTADTLIRGGEADGIASLQYRDRWVATSDACPNSQVVLYVTSVEKH